MVHVLLRDIRAKQDEHFTKLEAVETRVRHVVSQLVDVRMAFFSPIDRSADGRRGQFAQRVSARGGGVA